MRTWCTRSSTRASTGCSRRARSHASDDATNALLDPADRMDVRVRPHPRERPVRGVRLHPALPRVRLGVLRSSRGPAPLRALRLAHAAQPVRRTSTCGGTGTPTSTPRPSWSTPSSTSSWRGDTVVTSRCPSCEPMRAPPPPAPPGGRRRVCLFAGFDARRDRRRHSGRLRPRAEPVRRRLLPGRLRPGGRRAREARAVHQAAGGRSGTASTTSAPTPCWLVTSWAGTTIETYDELLLANDSSYLVRPWTRCSTAWSRGRSTGGGCRPPTTTSRPAS